MAINKVGTSGSVIRMLSMHVANKIAAGEVVERPASVVKELMENSIDAGAKKIEVEITMGGRRLISIADNGCGMVREDALLAPERQATSKIRDVNDIEHISTLGFRGEALASIASVSRFTLKTRRHEENVGTELLIQGGKLLDVKDCGCPPGTCIEVRDLFFNVPARRNFLKTFQTEQAHIKNMVLVHAIAYPSISFVLKCDGDEHYRYTAAKDLRERLLDIIGEEEFSKLVPFDGTHNRVHVYGYMGKPSWTRTDRGGQYIFINGRPAVTSTIHAAIRESYPRIEESRKPIFYMFIDVPPESVDVNVHPMKREVRFRNNNDVRDAIILAVSSAFSSNQPSGSVQTLPQERAEADRVVLEEKVSNDFINDVKQMQTSNYKIEQLKTSNINIEKIKPLTNGYVRPEPIPTSKTSSGIVSTLPPRDVVHKELPFLDSVTLPKDYNRNTKEDERVEIDNTDKIEHIEKDDDLHSDGFRTVPKVVGRTSPWVRYRVLGRLESGYFILETSGGFTVLDPAAAHERVVYEELLGQKEKLVVQNLLMPQTIEMNPIDAGRIKELLAYFKKLGFGIESFGASSFIVDAMPAVVSGVDCGIILLRTATALEEGGAKRKKDMWREEMIASVACKAAVSLKSRLTIRDVEYIVDKLVFCNMPYTSPSGKPTMIFTSSRELDRRFGRI